MNQKFQNLNSRTKFYNIKYSYKTLINQNFICKTQFHPLRDLQLQFKSEK